MAKQPPTMTDPIKMAEATTAERAWAGRHASYLSPTAQVVRQRVMPGETAAQAEARWEREREIERAYADDPRRDLAGGRVMPIRYD